jgi:DNA-directed RNA polymerase specialized sigma24 family protein
MRPFAQAVLGPLLCSLRPLLGDRAEDVAVDVLVAAWRHAPLWDRHRGSARGFVLTLARGIAMERLAAGRGRGEPAVAASRLALPEIPEEEARVLQERWSPLAAAPLAEGDRPAFRRALRALAERGLRP